MKTRLAWGFGGRALRWRRRVVMLCALITRSICMAGYSGTPLRKKLGIKDGARVVLLGAPAGFEGMLGAVADGVIFVRALRGKAAFDVGVVFVGSAAELAKKFGGAAERLAEDGGLWVAWPKKASGVKTDLTEDVVREAGLAAGLVDNKVCAIDETWSALRFVVRVKDRGKR